MSRTVNRKMVRGEVEKLLSKRKDIYPTPNRMSRAFRKANVMLGDEIIRDAVGKKELEELQIKRIRGWSKDKVLFEFKKSTFTRITPEVSEALDEKLEEIIKEAIERDKGDFECIDGLGFGPSTWKKLFRRIPGILESIEEKGMGLSEFRNKLYQKYRQRMEMKDT